MKDLLAWLATIPPTDRDAAIEKRLGIDAEVPSTPPGEHLVGHHASGVSAIVRMLFEVPVTSEDVVIDIGAGLGKVLLLTRLLTGARARGFEIQPELVERAREAARRLDLEVDFRHGDARAADLSEGTVFFLYLPFTGPVLAEVLERLHAVAEHHPIVVCTLGLDLDAKWLVQRPMDAFWLGVYESGTPREAATLSEAASRIACEGPSAP